MTIANRIKDSTPKALYESTDFVESERVKPNFHLSVLYEFNNKTFTTNLVN